MSEIKLYASCHIFTSELSDLTGGTEFILLPVPNVVPFYSTIHMNQPGYTSTLKGGGMNVPASLATLTGAPNFSTPDVVSSFAAGICNDFSSQIDGILNGLDKAKVALNSPFDLLNSELSGLIGESASSANDMLSGTTSISDAALSGVPDLPDVSELERVMQSCGLLRGGLLGGLMSPVDILGGFLRQAFDLLYSLVKNAMAALSTVFGLIEAGASFILNEINKLLNALGIGDLIAKFDGLITCIESICGQNLGIPENIGDPVKPTSEIFYVDYIDDTMDYVNNMLNDMNLDDFGQLDQTKIFADISGVPQDIFDNVSTLVNSSTDETLGAEVLIAGVVEDMKPMIDDMLKGMEGVTVEGLVDVQENQDAANELLATLEDTTDAAAQEEIIEQLTSLQEDASEILNPVTETVQKTQSFFT